MAAPVLEKFEEMILEVEFDPDGSPGTYTSICGMIDVTINRTLNVDEDEVPSDCDDESLPLAVNVEGRSLVVTVSGTGKWAQQNQSKMKEWIYNARKLNARLRDAAAAPGDMAVESGPALLTALNNSRTKGQAVSAEIEIRFSGRPVLAAAESNP